MNRINAINEQSRKIKSFFFGQYFADGIKITIGVLLPALVAFYFGAFETGVTISLGAVCISIADNPGPAVHKRNGMFFCALFVFLTALLTGLINTFQLAVIIEIGLLSFFYSMFLVYGARASSIGTAALLIMVLTLERPMSVTEVWLYSGLVLAGGAWYMLLSMSIIQLRPYRLAEQALGECVIETAQFIQIKAGFYDDVTPIGGNYKRLIQQQIVVNEKFDNLREILYRTRKMVSESTKPGRLMIMIFVDIIDLFEESMAIHYDYEINRNTYKHLHILPAFSKAIIKIANELELMGYALINNEKPDKNLHLDDDLENLKKQIDKLEADGNAVLVLKKILINLRNITTRINHIFGYFHTEELTFLSKTRELDLNKFVSHQEFELQTFKNNLNFNSSIFRHALRVSLVMLIGFFVAKAISFGHHSYWILLTILVILKPGFSLTKQRNYERIIGTIAGGILGALIVYFIKDATARFILLLIFMVISYSFTRIKYVVSVLFMTPYILLLFTFLGASNINIAGERIIDTLVGSTIAFVASYVIFPSWEQSQLNKFVSEILKANTAYLNQISNKFSDNFRLTDYKLARRDVYVSNANLASGFERMMNEPKSKQNDMNNLNNFMVLNHIFSSYLANYSSLADQHQEIKLSEKHLRMLRKTLFFLQEAINTIDKTENIISKNEQIVSLTEEAEQQDDLILEQLELLRKTAADIEKVTKKI